MSKLNALYRNLPAGKPVTAVDLAKLGISADLAVHYVRSGWLQRLSRGLYIRSGDSLLLHSSLRLLEAKLPGLHVGGKSALGWHGIRHYVAQQDFLHLYGWAASELPDWFLQHFSAEYHRKRLFDEMPGALLHVSRFQSNLDGPLVSSPERALLELLSEVGIRQPLQEAKELMESTYTLRADVLESLLMRCRSVKAVRLCLALGQEHSLPWVTKLPRDRLPTGSANRWVMRSNEGLLVLKP